MSRHAEQVNEHVVVVGSKKTCFFFFFSICGDLNSFFPGLFISFHSIVNRTKPSPSSLYLRGLVLWHIIALQQIRIH